MSDELRRRDRSREIRLQTYMIMASLAVLSFFAIMVLQHDKDIVRMDTVLGAVVKDISKLDDRVRFMEFGSE